eukprot:642989_1
MSSDRPIPIRLYVNHDLDKLKDFDQNDTFIDIDTQRNIDLDTLIGQITTTFNNQDARSQHIQQRLCDTSYTIHLYSYNDNTHIDHDDDLVDEIETVFPESDSDKDSDSDRDDEDTRVEIRMVFQPNDNDTQIPMQLLMDMGFSEDD